jgi:hypothetical protein
VDPKFFLVIAVAFVMGWYAIGTMYNVRRGEKLLKWMQSGLPRIGERTTFRWLGSSVAELVIGKGRGPTRRLELLLALAPRDLPWNWLFAELRGRRDVLILRVDLGSTPRMALEVANPKSWTGRMSLNQVHQEGWQAQEYNGMTLMAPAGLLKLAAEYFPRLEEPIHHLTASYSRFGLRKESPHLEIHIPFPDIKTVEADGFFAALQDLARAAHPPG